MLYSMPEACYRRPVSALQVKNVPEELHDELRRRASASGLTVGEIVLRAIRRELRSETLVEWAERSARLPLSVTRPTRAQAQAAHRDAQLEQR